MATENRSWSYLLVAAVILWNSGYLAAAFDSLASQEQPLDKEMAKHITPRGWGHISLTGAYVWNERSRPTRGQFRPLRRPLSLLSHLAYVKCAFVSAPGGFDFLTMRDMG